MNCVGTGWGARVKRCSEWPGTGSPHYSSDSIPVPDVISESVHSPVSLGPHKQGYTEFRDFEESTSEGFPTWAW